MKISQNGLSLVKAFESCMKAIGGGKFKAYLDPVNVLTIGWGHTNHHDPKFDASTVWTQQECDEALTRDMAIFEEVVNRLVKVPLHQHQFDALVSFAYNLGEGNLSKSALLRKLNAGDYTGAAAEFPNWVRAGGKVLAGLVRRRNSEMLMFQGFLDANYDGKPDTGPTAHAVDEPKPVLKRGSPFTSEVTRLQNLLGIYIDGIFGPKTEQAVRDFQQAKGLGVDGMVGPQTRAKLGM
jgi:lysozyme